MTAQSSTPTLSAARRTLTGKQVKQLRSEGTVPAVVYGHKKETVSLSINEKDFRKLYQEVGGSTLVNLSIDGEKAFKVLIHDVQEKTMRAGTVHVDFYQVNLKEKLRTSIPLEFVGESAAVTDLDGILMTVKDEIEIECLPDNLVQHIEVDISALKTFDDAIRVSDLVVPETITVLDDAEDMIASVTEPISQEALDALDETPATEIKTEFATEEGTVKDAESDKDEKKDK